MFWLGSGYAETATRGVEVGRNSNLSGVAQRTSVGRSARGRPFVGLSRAALGPGTVQGSI